jgi:hypothetical protein
MLLSVNYNSMKEKGNDSLVNIKIKSVIFSISKKD